MVGTFGKSAARFGLQIEIAFTLPFLAWGMSDDADPMWNWMRPPITSITACAPPL